MRHVLRFGGSLSFAERASLSPEDIAWAANRYQAAELAKGNRVSTTDAVRYVQKNTASAFADSDPVSVAIAAASDKNGGEVFRSSEEAVAAAAREYLAALKVAGVAVSMPEAVKAVEARARQEWTKSAEAEIVRIRKARNSGVLSHDDAVEHLKSLLGG